MKKLMLSVFALAAVVLSANAAQSVNGTASASVISQVSISNDLTGYTLAPGVAAGLLKFGNITVSAVSGEVTIAAATGARSKTGGVEILNSVITPSAAAFAVTGSANGTYTIGLPANGAITLTGPGTALVVKDFLNSSAGTLDALGKQMFSVGATLEIAADQTTGSYSGLFPVTVAYN